MPEYDATFVRVLRVIGRITFKAKNADAADEKLTAITNEVGTTHPVTVHFESVGKKAADIEWEIDTDDGVEDEEINEL